MHFRLCSAPSGGFTKKTTVEFLIFFFWSPQFWSKFTKISCFVLGTPFQSYFNVQQRGVVRGCFGTGLRGSTEPVSFQRGVLEPFNFGKIQEKLDILALLLPNFRFLPLSRRFRTPPFKSAAQPLLVCAETDLLRGNFSLTYFLIFHWKIIKVSTGATAKEGQKIDILLIRLYQKFISERSSICCETYSKGNILVCFQYLLYHVCNIRYRRLLVYSCTAGIIFSYFEDFWCT